MSSSSGSIIGPATASASAPGPTPVRPQNSTDIILMFITIVILGVVIFLLLINPKKNIVENSKHVYNSSIEKMNTTYGSVKRDAEKAAQNAKDKWTSNIKSIYKIITLSIIVFFILIYNFIIVDKKPSLLPYVINLLLLVFLGFEFYSDKLDNVLFPLFHDIEKKYEKTKDNIKGENPTDKVKDEKLNVGLMSVILFWFTAKVVHAIYLHRNDINLFPVQSENSMHYFIAIAIHLLSAIGVLFSLYFKEKNMTEYKGFVFYLLFVFGIVANIIFMTVFNSTPPKEFSALSITNMVQISFNVLFFALLIFELLSNKIDDAIHKNTVDNNIHHKTLSTVFTVGLFIASILYYVFPHKSDLLGKNINISMMAIFFLLSLFVLFNFPGFDSEYYIFVLFFILNIPLVYLFITRMLSGTDDKTKFFIPLFIGFYTICMIILAMMGTIDMSNHTNIYLLVGLVGFLLLSYTMKFITDPKYKTLFSLIALIILSIATLYYTLTSRLWYVFLLLFIFILFYFDIIHIPGKPAMPSSGPPSVPVTPLEKKILAGEVIFILLFLYGRTLLKSTYTKNGQSMINSPVKLKKHTNVKVDKKFQYIYGVSCWVKLDPMAPNSVQQANEYVTILTYGNTPTISYCGALNSLRVEMQDESKKMRIMDTIRNVPLQKWNHIAINYVDGICDVFINGELHNSKKNVVPYNNSSELIVGSHHTIRGEICNVVVFYESFTRPKVKQLYNDFKDKNPPVF
jgi:hypothetical protein